ncbi:MAG: hypothetical protein ABSC05_07745 [Candidatus Solibacter sp.]|jgi:hypothetical protein
MKTGIVDVQGRGDDTTHKLPIRGAKPGPATDWDELRLPDPVVPRYPEKWGDVEPDPKYPPRDGNPYRTRVTVPIVARALRGWLYPYIGSLSYCYNASRAIRWVLKQAAHGFQGTTGGFED